jgi:hypothetical protein
MKQPDMDQYRAIAQVAIHNPRFAEWLREWQKMELSRLPQVTTNVAVAQGRCQVLAEICAVLDKAPAEANS